MPPINDSLTKFGSVFQTKIITSLLSDHNFAVTIYDMLRPELLDTEAKQWIVRNIKEYYYEYKTMPSLQVLKIKLGDVSTDLLRDSIVDELREVTKNLESPDLEFRYMLIYFFRCQSQWFSKSQIFFFVFSTLTIFFPNFIVDHYYVSNYIYKLPQKLGKLV